MSKYKDDLGEDLVKKVKDMAVELGIKANGIDVRPVRLKKANGYVGEVAKPNDAGRVVANDNEVVVVALYQPAFDIVDEQTQDFWIESLLDRIEYNPDKDITKIKKPEISLSRSLYKKYSNVAIQKMELAIDTIAQIEDMKRQEKEEKAAEKKEKRAMQKGAY